MNKSHKRALRRDRRKAKATEWKRAGKTSMGSRVGHGTVGAGHKSFVAVSAPTRFKLSPSYLSELARLAQEIGSGEFAGSEKLAETTKKA